MGLATPNPAHGVTLIVPTPTRVVGVSALQSIDESLCLLDMQLGEEPIGGSMERLHLLGTIKEAADDGTPEILDLRKMPDKIGY